MIVVPTAFWYNLDNLLIITLAYLGLAAILADRNARISADPAKAREGILEWITPPTAPTTKRGYPVWFYS